MVSLPDTATLLPQEHPLATGGTLYAFPSASTDLVKIDLIHEAGSAYQPQPLCAAAAHRLFAVASGDMDARQVAEFMDYRGIVVDHNPDILTASTSVYFLRRYLDELLPVLQQLLLHPAFPQDDFEVFLSKRRQELQAMQRKTREVARRLFYQTLFGTDHPLGRYAEPDDADRLDRDTVVRFFHERYRSRQLIVSGNIDAELIEKVTESLVPLQVEESKNQKVEELISTFHFPACLQALSTAESNIISEKLSTFKVAVPGAVQTTLRVGRILPLRWDSVDYARFMLLTTLLGGYFGSRLMSNLREDKGYTYGIQAHTQIYRGVIVLYITTDVAASAADAAEEEIRRELQRLCDEPVGDDELAMVKTVLTGDFIRSVDGVFERSERLRSMLATHVDETLTDNLREALQTTTADHLLQLSRRFLQPADMLYCRAGAI